MTSQSSWLVQTESQLGLVERMDLHLNLTLRDLPRNLPLRLPLNLPLVQTLSPHHQQNRLGSTTLQKARMILFTTIQWTWSQGTRRRRRKRRSCTSLLCGLPVRSSHLQNRGGGSLPVSLSPLPSHQRTTRSKKARRPIVEFHPRATNAI